MAAIGTERLHIVLRGAVQGIGFCPTIYRIAQRLHLAGWVRDTDAGIEIEVEGGAAQLETFLRLLKSQRPRAAVVAMEEVVRIVPRQSAWFEILPSERREAIPPPSAISAE